MPITVPSLDSVVAAALAFYRNRFTSRDLGLEAFLGKLSRAEAMLFLQFMQAVTAADADACPNPKSSTAALDLWATTLGVPSSTSGAYGRKGATNGTGGTAPVTGTAATSIPDGSLLTAADGSTIVKLNNAGSPLVLSGTSGSGSATGTFDSVTTGTVGNLPANSVLTWQSPPAGLDATVTLTKAISGGIDSETNAQLLARILARLQTPPKGCTSSDFRTFAEAQSGIVRAYPYPLRGGLGTVHIVLTASGSGTARKPTSAQQTTVDSAINGTSSIPALRTVTIQGYKSLIPYTVATGMTIRVRLLPFKPKYAFDWDDTAGTYTVSAYAAGPPATITLSGALPATLMAAVDAGSKPRLQICSTGTSPSSAPATPFQVGVTAYNSGSRVLTLDTLPSNFVAPNINDSIYAGGPMVSQIASSILAYVDGLGPARGNYADANDAWFDTVYAAKIVQLCLDAVDGDGTPFARNFFYVFSTPQCLISYNGGGSAFQDVAAQDTTANGPELLYLKSGGIAVTQ